MCDKISWTGKCIFENFYLARDWPKYALNTGLLRLELINDRKSEVVPYKFYNKYTSSKNEMMLNFIKYSGTYGVYQR